MDRQKLEKIILIVIIPVFLLFLIYFLAKNRTRDTSAVSQESIEDIIKRVSIPEKLMTVKYESSRDPLRDLINAYYIKKEAELKLKNPEKPLEPPPLVKIEGLLWNTNKPQAIVAGRILNVGDEVEGFKILEIGKEGITIEYSGNPLLLTPKRSFSSETRQSPE
jgi:competence protein ComGC